jgi:hypothetical protein
VIGLFTGAVILALGYELTHAWITAAQQDAGAPVADATG